jgi:HEAT repeats/PBS lyase HEAT-like repeat
MRNAPLACAALAACAVAAATAHATLVPMLDVTELEKGARVIAVGEVTSAREVGRGVFTLNGREVNARIMEATVRTERVLKGKWAAEYEVRFYDPEHEMLGYDYVHEGLYGLFFLKREGDFLAFVSPYHVSVVASRGACESGGEPLARVAAEMTCVLRAAGSKTLERYQAISALATIKTEAGAAALKSAAQEQPEPLNYIAADELIRRGDLSLLPIAERALQKSYDIRIDEEGFKLSTGWNSIEGISDRRAIPALSRLVHAPDVRTRQAALRALGQTKDAAARAALLEGLDDAEAGVRWYAVMALAELAGEDEEGGEWYPDFKRFEEDEGLYITHWKGWALGLHP